MIPAWPDSERKPEWPDGPLKDFLHSLQRPDNDRHPGRDKYARSCCDAGDTVKTKFKVEPGDGKHPEDRWYAWLNERWVAIPPEKIVPGHAPNGQAYLFLMDFRERRQLGIQDHRLFRAAQRRAVSAIMSSMMRTALLASAPFLLAFFSPAFPG